MSLNRKTDSSVLSENIDELALEDVHGRTWIVVHVKDVTEAFHTGRLVIVSARSRIDKTGWIKLPGKFHSCRCIELTPCLIERNPHHDALEVLERIDDVGPLAVVVVLPLLRDDAVCATEEAVA